MFRQGRVYFMKRKYNRILAKILILVILLVMPGMQGSIVCAEDDGETPKTRGVAITKEGIVEDRDFGDLHTSNTSLIIGEDAGGALQSQFCCDVTNTGSRTFKGMLRFCFYDSNGHLMIVLIGYFGDNLPPGEKETITSSTNLDMTDAVSMSIQKQSWQNKDINTSVVFDDILEMYGMTLTPTYLMDQPESWELRFQMKVLSGQENQIPDEFPLHIFFRNELGDIEFQTQENIKKTSLVESYHNTVNSYGVDLSNICSIEISADLSGSTPTLSPAATATAQPTPTRSAENTSVPQPSQAPGILPTEEPAKTQMPGETVSPIPYPTLPVTAKPSGTPVPTAQPQAPTSPPTRLPETTDFPTASFTASPMVKPTQAPEVLKPGKAKLIRPIIRVKTKKLYNNMWMARIRIIKYQGTDIQIYYRRGKGKYKRIKLKRTNIKKNKKIFKVGYKKGKKNIYLRVRTYQKKGGKKWYSPYSKIRRLS